MTAAGAAAPARPGVRGGAAGLAGAAVSGAAGFVLTMVIVRGLGAAGSGELFTAIAVVTIAAAVCCAGADTALVWALPRRRTGADGDAARLLPVALLPALLAAAAVAAVGAAAGPAPLRPAFAAVPVVVAATVLLAAVRAVRPVGAYVAVQSVFVPVARPALVGGVLAAGAGVGAAFAGWLLPAAVAAVAAAALLAGPLALGRGAALRPAPADWRTFWSFAGPRGVSAAIDAGGMWVGVLLTAALAGDAQAGLFGAVGRYVLAGLLVMHGLRVAVAPRLSRLLGDDRRAAAAAVYRRTTTAIVALSWPGFAVLGVFAPGFLQLFGAEFTAGAPAMALLCAAMAVNAGVGIVQTVLLMGGRSGRHLLATAAGLALTVALSLVLVPRHGALGAAVAWTAGIVAENALAAVAARAVLGQGLWDRTIARTALLAGGGTLLLAGAVAAVAGRGVTGLAVTTGLLLLTVAASALHPAVRALARTIRRPA
ncbi:lipopolysaccharide biosynthesis protein [Spirilliplanes yamanashiensis]|uniref:O-antigen/teichoic acid export membrane protein n=1 Tax=Spirilliplanes yamanashiensis TaxID=42233 RepID=A0A8J3YBQ7_9ACTN|nr:lipopolysaccharide biosynthesis protein [Spirilliplanes yamanashiensis]MDP9818161.1 O-antigen/teichoic acid export membrane protein [Spirilliplanes yamanashiensis]GIJ04972.1 hypothetical protein Sya03_43240 [Spirilliplanes yamanashiensis]